MPTNPDEPTIWGAGASVEIPGPPGDPGPPGPPPNLTKGNVTSGIDADFTIRGTTPDYILDLVLPEGPPGSPGGRGDPGLFTSVTVTMLAVGATPTATIGGTSQAQTLVLGIPEAPKGEDGNDGDPGPAGPIAGESHVGTGVKVITGLGGQDGNLLVHLTLLDSRNIKATADPDHGIKLRYAPSYVRVVRTSDAAATSPYDLRWQEAAGSDTSAFNVSTPERITIPSEIGQVEFTGQVMVSKTVGEEVTVELLRNGAAMTPRVMVRTEADVVTITSGVLTVGAGDNFRLQVTSDNLTQVQAQASWLEAKFYP